MEVPGRQGPLRLEELRVAVLPGEGLVAKFGSALLVVVAKGRPCAPVVAQLVDACRAATGGAGELARLLGSTVGSAGQDGDVSFCAVVDGAEGLSILVHGDIQVSIRGGEPVVNLLGNGGPISTVLVPGGLTSLAIGERDRASGVELPDQLLDLRDGLVPGCGAMLEP
ncbi:MAG: hypothetical protein ACRDY2_11595, partial [Acidimicrobiales bacterium]